MSMLAPNMPIHLRVAMIEDALARVCGQRGANDLRVNDLGERILHVYDYDTPSAHGGCVSVTLNLSLIARDLERELS